MDSDQKLQLQILSLGEIFFSQIIYLGDMSTLLNCGVHLFAI